MRHQLKSAHALVLALALLAAPLAACGDDGGSSGGGNNSANNNSNNNPIPAGEELRSDKQRVAAPDASETELATLTRDNRAFALDIYQEIGGASGGNLFLSPHSISIALAMTYGGARGETAAEMAEALRFSLGPERLHTAFNALDLEMQRRGQDVELEEGQTGAPFQLSVVNAIWGQTGYEFLSSYLDLLALNYGAGLRALDFDGDPEGARETINGWVEDQTNDRIRDLLPEGSIDPSTVLVLTNAVYFKASWQTPFDESQTRPATFTSISGGSAEVPTMHIQEGFGYASGEGYEAVELPYVGGELSMVVIAPDAGTFEAFEAGLDVDGLDAILGGLGYRSLELALPKFGFESSVDLVPPLMALGMESAFGDADFSGINGQGGLAITGVFHKTFVAVDEEGTEAAAATAVVVGETSVPEFLPVAIDRPFIFLIRDIKTGAVIFLGRVVELG